jgi:hypothetical protein
VVGVVLVAKNTPHGAPAKPAPQIPEAEQSVSSAPATEDDRIESS